MRSEIVRPGTEEEYKEFYPAIIKFLETMMRFDENASPEDKIQAGLIAVFQEVKIGIHEFGTLLGAKTNIIIPPNILLQMAEWKCNQ